MIPIRQMLNATPPCPSAARLGCAQQASASPHIIIAATGSRRDCMNLSDTYPATSAPPNPANSNNDDVFPASRVLYFRLSVRYSGSQNMNEYLVTFEKSAPNATAHTAGSPSILR